MSNYNVEIINEAQAISAGINPAIFRGSNAYLHIRFAAVGNPTDDQISETPDEFIGLCANHEATAPTDAASYIWARINYAGAEAARVEAEQGRVTAEQGRGVAEQNRATAEQGRAEAEQNRVTAEQGRETSEAARVAAENAREAAPKYLYVRYSMVEAPTNAQMSSSPANCEYIGFAVTASKTAPTAASAYAWARFRGLNGEGAGDMLAETYDADNDGIVDVAMSLHEDAVIEQSQVHDLDTALAGKATANHNHDGTYQPAGNYAAGSHNHDGTYQPAGSYASANHNHSGTYAPVSHDHAIANVTELEAALAGKATVAKFTATIPTSGWVANGDAFKLDTVSAAGMLATDEPVTGPVQSGDETTDSVIRENYGKLTRIVAKAGGITLYASEIPSAAIPIKMQCTR